MLKNVQEAKFNKIMIPIAELVLATRQTKYLCFDALFEHILSHEVMHGLGPHNISINGRYTTVAAELAEYHNALEEAKADLSGVWMLMYLINNKKVDLRFNFSSELQHDTGLTYEAKLKRSLFVTYVVGLFRSLRFGTQEAHGQAAALQLSYFREKGALFIEKEPNTVFSVNFDNIEPVIQMAVTEIMHIQATGAKSSAAEMLSKYELKEPQILQKLEELNSEENGIPIDILPKFPLMNILNK